VRDSVKNYLTLATGLTAVTRARALGAAKSLVSQGEATAGQVQSLAEDLFSTSRSNREALVGLVRYEIDRALGRVGLASSDDLAALRARVRSLEATVHALEAQVRRGGTRTPGKTAAKKTTKTAAADGAAPTTSPRA
jgi:polyhydroxyalkanoate synthesis regulator phasin